jgi:hypothetical protein
MSFCGQKKKKKKKKNKKKKLMPEPKPGIKN